MDEAALKTLSATWVQRSERGCTSSSCSTEGCTAGAPAHQSLSISRIIKAYSAAYFADCIHNCLEQIGSWQFGSNTSKIKNAVLKTNSHREFLPGAGVSAGRGSWGQGLHQESTPRSRPSGYLMMFNFRVLPASGKSKPMRATAARPAQTHRRLQHGTDALRTPSHNCHFLQPHSRHYNTGKSFHLNAKQMQHVNMLKGSDAEALSPQVNTAGDSHLF